MVSYVVLLNDIEGFTVGIFGLSFEITGKKNTMILFGKES